MNTYYDEEGKVLGHAWSAAIPCDKTKTKEEHEPHVHNPPFTCYGPYMCEGYPKVKLYKTPPRKPVN